MDDKSIVIDEIGFNDLDVFEEEQYRLPIKIRLDTHVDMKDLPVDIKQKIKGLGYEEYSNSIFN